MTVKLDDTALMLRYRDGDVTAFETLYARHRAPLYRFLLRQIGNRQYAEDIFQETWSRVIRNKDGYRASARFTTYLYHLARNCSVDHFRRNTKHADLAEIDEHTSATAIISPDNPAVDAANADAGIAISAALRALPAEQREAFLLQQEGDFSLQEIATLTGVGRETVKSRLRYALGSLRKHLGSPDIVDVKNG